MMLREISKSLQECQVGVFYKLSASLRKCSRSL